MNFEEKLFSLLSGHAVEQSNTANVHSQGLIDALKIILLITPCYGLVMGGYGWIAGYRDLNSQLPQMVYSALKMPLLITTTVAVAMPAFFVFNTLARLRTDFAEAVNAILSSLATFSIAIISLAPFTILFYISLPESRLAYRIAVLFNGLVFAVATLAAHVSLLRNYRPLICRHPLHRRMLWVWLVLFALVGIQLGWTLRPFVGHPWQEITFFREESFTNAFIELVRIVRSVIELGGLVIVW